MLGAAAPAAAAAAVGAAPALTAAVAAALVPGPPPPWRAYPGHDPLNKTFFVHRVPPPERMAWSRDVQRLANSVPVTAACGSID